MLYFYETDFFPTSPSSSTIELDVFLELTLWLPLASHLYFSQQVPRLHRYPPCGPDVAQALSLIALCVALSSPTHAPPTSHVMAPSSPVASSPVALSIPSRALSTSSILCMFINDVHKRVPHPALRLSWRCITLYFTANTVTSNQWLPIRTLEFFILATVLSFSHPPLRWCPL